MAPKAFVLLILALDLYHLCIIICSLIEGEKKNFLPRLKYQNKAHASNQNAARCDCYKWPLLLHVQSIIMSCGVAKHCMLCVRCAHGLRNSTLQTIYRAVVIAKLTYASSAWVGFTTANDQQKISALIHRSKHSGFSVTELDNFETLCITADN